jgi:hypothetical protein
MGRIAEKVWGGAALRMTDLNAGRRSVGGFPSRAVGGLGAWGYRTGNQRKLSTARATILMIVSADEEDATVEVDIYFTGLSPDARIRAAAFLGIPDRVMATREVAKAKLRMLDFMAILLLALAAGC